MRSPNFTWDGKPIEVLELPRSPVRKTAHKDRGTVDATTRSCTACGLREKCKSPLPPSFPTTRTSSFVVIATAPTPLDDRKGQVFVSRGGQVLRKLAREVGLDVDAGAWMNTVACATESPEGTHLESCRGNLIAGLHAANTRYALLCGAVAVGSWRDDVKVSRVRGRWFIWWEREEWDLPGAGGARRGWWVLPTFHPAAVLKNPSLRGELRDDLAAFADVVNGHTTPAPSLVCVECGEDQTRWDGDGVGWCEACWMKRVKGKKMGTSRRHKLSPDQGSFRF